MKLYDYYRSTACYRVRIALNIKKMDYETVEIHLVQSGGEHLLPEYRKINPQMLVPALETDHHILTQSLAIMEYLDEVYPNPSILPKDPIGKAMVRSLALTIACDMHPLNNLRVLQKLRNDFDADEDAVTTWYHHWLKAGFDALETRIVHIPRDPRFCYGDQVSLADICLIPQIYNANRFHFDMSPYPALQAIWEYCSNLQSFQKAHP